MITRDDLREATRRFFAKHWNPALCDQHEPPDWSEPWELVGEMPGSARQGCYALVEGGVVTYIGKGGGRGSGGYPECGLGKRIGAYMRRAKDKGRTDGQRVYEFRELYRKHTGIMTIAFPSGYGYLALALEAYLIAEFTDKGLTNKHSMK